MLDAFLFKVCTFFMSCQPISSISCQFTDPHLEFSLFLQILEELFVLLSCVELCEYSHVIMEFSVIYN